MKVFLTIAFVCGFGCGEPPEVTIAFPYKSIKECQDAAAQWTAPSADPMHVIHHTRCKKEKD